MLCAVEVRIGVRHLMSCPMSKFTVCRYVVLGWNLTTRATTGQWVQTPTLLSCAGFCAVRGLQCGDGWDDDYGCNIGTNRAIGCSLPNIPSYYRRNDHYCTCTGTPPPTRAPTADPTALPTAVPTSYNPTVAPSVIPTSADQTAAPSSTIATSSEPATAPSALSTSAEPATAVPTAPATAPAKTSTLALTPAPTTDTLASTEAHASSRAATTIIVAVAVAVVVAAAIGVVWMRARHRSRSQQIETDGWVQDHSKSDSNGTHAWYQARPALPIANPCYAMPLRADVRPRASGQGSTPDAAYTISLRADVRPQTQSGQRTPTDAACAAQNTHRPQAAMPIASYRTLDQTQTYAAPAQPQVIDNPDYGRLRRAPSTGAEAPVAYGALNGAQTYAGPHRPGGSGSSGYDRLGGGQHHHSAAATGPPVYEVVEVSAGSSPATQTLRANPMYKAGDAGTSA